MWRRWPQATNFMGYQPFRGPGNRLFKIMRNTKKKEIDSSKWWEIPKKGNLLEIMRNSWKIDPSMLLEKRKSTLQRFFLPFKQRNLLSIFFWSIFWLIITRNILQYIFYFIYNFQLAEFAVPSGCVVKANIVQRHWKRNYKSRYSEDQICALRLWSLR